MMSSSHFLLMSNDNSDSYSPKVVEPGVVIGKNVLFDGPDITLRKSARIDSGFNFKWSRDWSRCMGKSWFSCFQFNTSKLYLSGNQLWLLGASQQASQSKNILGSLDLDQYNFNQNPAA